MPTLHRPSPRAALAIDGALTFVLLLIGATMDFAHPTERSFHVDDTTIDLPFQTHETVSSELLLTVSICVPILSFVAIHFIRRRLSFVSHSILLLRIMCLFQAFAINLLVTETLKLTVGELRPDFLSRCEPVRPDDCEGGDPCPYECTGDPAFIREGRKSFPSGHSSISFTAMVLIALVLAFEVGLVHTAGQRRRLAAQARREPTKIYHAYERQPLAFARLCITLAPIFIAILIAVSRIIDNRHHPHDVLAGALIGTVSSSLVFFIHHQHGRAAHFRDIGGGDGDDDDDFGDQGFQMEEPAGDV